MREVPRGSLPFESSSKRQVRLRDYIHSTFIQNCYFNRWGFCPLVEAERFQHDFVFRYLAKHVEDNFPEALEELLKKEDKK